MRALSNVREARSPKLNKASGKVPVHTFEICNRCGLVALTPQEVDRMIGYRRVRGKWVTQPNCHKCRYALHLGSKKPTGPNKNKIDRPVGVVFGSQEKDAGHAPDRPASGQD